MRIAVKGTEVERNIGEWDGLSGPVARLRRVEHRLNERQGGLTSIGLRNVTFTSIGPASMVRIVRVGVTVVPVSVAFGGNVATSKSLSQT